MVKSATPLATSGDGEIELYSIYEGSIVTGSGIVLSSSGGNYPPSGDPPDIDVEEDQIWTKPNEIRFIVASVAKAPKYGVAGLSIRSLDDDGFDGMDKHWDTGDGETSEFQAALAMIGMLAAASGTAKLAVLVGISGSMVVVLGLLVGLGVGLGIMFYGDELWDAIRNAWAGGDDDEMGTGMWTYSWGPKTWFGDHPHKKNEQKRPATEDGKIGYEVDFKLIK